MIDDADLPCDWTDEQHRVFRRVFQFLSQSQVACIHPGAALMLEQHWDTVCFNAAYTAAHFADPDAGEIIVHVDDGGVLASSAPGLLN